jgi:hypothetical protein
LDKQRVLEGLLQAIEAARLRGDPAAMIRGWSEIGRMCGSYDAPQAAKVDTNIVHKRHIQHLETLPDEELCEAYSCA